MPRHKVVVINFESLLTSIRLHMPESLLKATEAEVPDIGLTGRGIIMVSSERRSVELAVDIRFRL